MRIYKRLLLPDYVSFQKRYILKY